MKRINKIEEMDKKYINELLEELANTRPIFHNEQDFQFELAKKINESIDNKDIVVRLEYFIGESEKDTNEQEKSNKKGKNRIYIDIMIIENTDKEKNKAIAMELKYKTKEIKEGKRKFENEWYHLTDQGAVDWGCYYIYKDLKRIESLIYPTQEEKEEHYNLENIIVEKGYVIFLTNDYKAYKTKRKGIFKNYTLIDEKNLEKITIKDEEIKYCHKEKPYEEYSYQDILKDYLSNGKLINYSSIEGKEPIVFTKEHKGEWSIYSKLERKDNYEWSIYSKTEEKYDREMCDIVEKLIFEVKKD